MPHDENIVMHIFWRLVVAFTTKKLSQKAFSDRAVSYFQVGTTIVLSGEHMVFVVLAGLDTISMRCYLAASRSLVMSQCICF